MFFFFFFLIKQYFTDLSCFENKPANKNVVFEESLINQPVSYTKRRIIYDSSSEEDSDEGDFVKPLNKYTSAIKNQQRQKLSKKKSNGVHLS